MKYLNLIVASLMGVSFSLAAQAVASDIIHSPLENYTVTDIMWEVPITPDRTDTVTGTVEDVIRYLETVAPEILPEANITSVPSPGPQPASVPAPIHGGAVAKSYKKPDKLLCNNLPFTANPDRIKDGWLYLEKVKGKPTNGPKSCGQVSCSWGSFISWCNDNSESLTLDSFKMIADGAHAVYDNCERDFRNRFTGQAFYDGGWNVMVASKSKC